MVSFHGETRLRWPPSRYDSPSPHPRHRGGLQAVTWSEEWGEDRKRRRRADDDGWVWHATPGSSGNIRPEESEEDAEERRQRREREKNDHYWANPRDVGQDHYRALMPSRPLGVQPIEKALAVSYPSSRHASFESLVCGPCRSGHHANCLRSFHLDDGGEEVLCECADDAHWTQSTGGV